MEGVKRCPTCKKLFLQTAKYKRRMCKKCEYKKRRAKIEADPNYWKNQYWKYRTKNLLRAKRDYWKRREKILVRVKQYQQTHRAERKAYFDRWYSDQKNRARCREAAKRWKKENPDLWNAQRRRIARSSRVKLHPRYLRRILRVQGVPVTPENIQLLRNRIASRRMKRSAKAASGVFQLLGAMGEISKYGSRK